MVCCSKTSLAVSLALFVLLIPKRRLRIYLQDHPRPLVSPFLSVIPLLHDHRDRSTSRVHNAGVESRQEKQASKARRQCQRSSISSSNGDAHPSLPSVGLVSRTGPPGSLLNPPGRFSALPVDLASPHEDTAAGTRASLLLYRFLGVSASSEPAACLRPSHRHRRLFRGPPPRR